MTHLLLWTAGMFFAGGELPDIAAVPLEGPDAAAAVGWLREIVRDPARPEPSRAAAADRLGRIDEEAVSAIPDLIVVARNERSRWALKALTRFGPRASEAGELFESLAGDADLGPVALEGLALTLPRRPRGLAVFRQQLQGEDPSAALDALSLAGPTAAAILPAVIRLAEHPDPRVRRLTVPVLEQAGRADAMAALAAIAAADGGESSAAAVAALGRRRRVDILRQLMAEAEGRQRLEVATALLEAGDDAARLMEDADEAVAAAAAARLMPSAVAARRLVALLASPDRAVAKAAGEALLRFRADPAVRDATREASADPERVRRLKARIRDGR